MRVGVMLSMDAGVKALHMDALCEQRLKTDKDLLQTQGRPTLPPLSYHRLHVCAKTAVHM